MLFRTRRVAKAVAAASLALTTAAAAPSIAAPLDGILTVTFSYETKTPMTVLASFTDAAGHSTGQVQATSSFSENRPGGTTYGAVLVGGWGGVTCVNLTPCSWLSIQGDPMAARPTVDAPLLTTGGTALLSGTIAMPKLSGSGAVGSPLSIIVPPGLTDLATSFDVLFPEAPGATEPGVTWLRNGVQIAGASGLTYTPTTADAGRTISAVVAYPTLLSGIWGAGYPALVPGPLTTSGIAVPAAATPPTPPAPATVVTPAIKLAVPAKVAQGKRPKVYVTVKNGAAAVPGIVKLKIGKKRALQATLRAGLATFTLPRLKPGRYAVTATYVATTDYASVTTTKKVTIKKKPKRRD